MKTGKSITELAIEIERQAANKVDYLAPTPKLEMVPRDKSVSLVLHNGEDREMKINELAHRQIGERVGIPAKYYDRMASADPELLAYNVNRWFNREPEKRLVRTLDGTARAFLSDRFQRGLDNINVAQVALPVLAEVPGLEFVSTEITERRMYIKAVTNRVTAEIKSRRVGDVVRAGVIITNSEVGLGAISIFPFFDFLACLNGMVRQKDGMRHAHVGTKLDDEDGFGVLANDTVRAIDHAILLRVRDHVSAALNEVRFREAIERMQAQTEQQITGSVPAAIEVLSNDFQLGEAESNSILKHLIQGGDLSRYGLMNAVTRTAEDSQSYDRATEIETLGGRILDLPNRDWERIALAA